jgi:hypothetical protein
MNAVITTTKQTITGKTLKEIKREMNRLLNVLDKRALTAITDTGAEIHVEKYDGQDYIKLANGRILK